MIPEASFHTHASIYGVWLQRSVESSSKIITAIHTQPIAWEESSELQVLHLQLSSERQKSSFHLVAGLALPGFCLWLLEGDFIVIVDENMVVKIWNWKSDQWGIIRDPTNEVDENALVCDITQTLTSIHKLNLLLSGVDFRT